MPHISKQMFNHDHPVRWAMKRRVNRTPGRINPFSAQIFSRDMNANGLGLTREM
jgi:hypothetical protein